MNTPESPIKRFAPDWRELSLEGKRQWLMHDGQARTWSEASSLLSRHGHAVARARKLRRPLSKEMATAPRQVMPHATVEAKCDLCNTVVYKHLRFDDGSRAKRVVTSHRHDKFTLMCLACVETPEGLALIERAARHGLRGDDLKAA